MAGISSELQWNATEREIKAGEVFELPIYSDQGAVLDYSWNEVEGQAAGFIVKQGNDEILSRSLLSSGHGQLKIPTSGLYNVVWDNHDSWLYPITISYNLVLVQSTQRLAKMSSGGIRNKKKLKVSRRCGCCPGGVKYAALDTDDD